MKRQDFNTTCFLFVESRTLYAPDHQTPCCNFSAWQQKRETLLSFFRKKHFRGRSMCVLNAFIVTPVLLEHPGMGSMIKSAQHNWSDFPALLYILNHLHNHCEFKPLSERMFPPYFRSQNDTPSHRKGEITCFVISFFICCGSTCMNIDGRSYITMTWVKNNFFNIAHLSNCLLISNQPIT